MLSLGWESFAILLTLELACNPVESYSPCPIFHKYYNIGPFAAWLIRDDLLHDICRRPHAPAGSPTLQFPGKIRQSETALEREYLGEVQYAVHRTIPIGSFCRYRCDTFSTEGHLTKKEQSLWDCSFWLEIRVNPVGPLDIRSHSHGRPGAFQCQAWKRAGSAIAGLPIQGPWTGRG